MDVPNLAGSICRAEPTDPADGAALVLVTGVLSDSDEVAVTLLSPDVELGTSLDLLLARADTGLRYELLAQSDVFGYLPAEHLRCTLGRVDQVVLGALAALRDDDHVPLPVGGPPLWCRADPRWQFKLSELDRLHTLAR